MVVDAALPIDTPSTRLRERMPVDRAWAPVDEGAHTSLGAAVAKRSLEPAATLGLVVSYGAFFLLLLVRHYEKNGITEADERLLYLVPGLFAPPFALAMGWLFLFARRTLFRDSIVFPLAMAAANALFWAVGLLVFRRAITNVGEAGLIHRTGLMCWAFGLTNVIAFALCLPGRWIRLSVIQRQILRKVVDDGHFLLPVAAAFAAAIFSNYDITRWSTFIVPCAFALPAFALANVRTPAHARPTWLIDAVALILIVGLAFNPNYPFDERHYSFFMGPTAALMAGKRILVDVNCQYGVGVIYFLALVFKLHLVPMTYQGMSALLNVLGIVYFVGLYLLLRLCLRSQRHCLWALVVMLVIRLFSGAAVFTVLPSLGPLRFMWGYALLLCTALRERWARRATALRAAQAAVVGIASVWSVETFAGTFTTFLAVVFFSALFGGDPLLRRVKEAAKTLGSGLLAMAIAHGLLTADIRMHTASWPHWSQYGAYLKLYSRVDFWAMPITPWEPWAPVVLAYFASLVALLARPLLFGRRGVSLEERLVFGLSVLGMVEFSHYVGRSYIDHLRIYSADIFVAAYWMDRAARRPDYLPAAFRTALVGCIYGAGGMLVLSAMPGFAQKVPDTLFGRLAIDQPVVGPRSLDQDLPWRGSPRGKIRQEAFDLVTKYQPDRGRIALFIDQFLRPLVFMQTGKAHVWPIGTSDQDDAEPEAKARVLAFADGMKVGDLIFVGPGLAPLDEQILGGLRARFHFSPLESSPSGIQVVRLDASH